MKRFFVIEGRSKNTKPHVPGKLEIPAALPQIAGASEGSEILLEHILAAVMKPDATPESLIEDLSKNLGHIRVAALIRATLVADQIISRTFENSDDGRPYAELARAAALNFSMMLDDAETEHFLHSSFTLGEIGS